MIQFSRPKKSLAAALDPFRRYDTATADSLDKGRVPGPAPSRFDSFYRNGVSGGIPPPPDAQSVVSQAITAAYPQLPKIKSYAAYASSVISQQQGDNVSVAGGTAPSIAFSQFDRLPIGNGHSNGDGRRGRRLSFGSLAPSDAPSGMYGYGYKAGVDDDAQSVTTTQAGLTEF